MGESYKNISKISILFESESESEYKINTRYSLSFTWHTWAAYHNYAIQMRWDLSPRFAGQIFTIFWIPNTKIIKIINSKQHLFDWRERKFAAIWLTDTFLIGTFIVYTHKFVQLAGASLLDNCISILINSLVEIDGWDTRWIATQADQRKCFINKALSFEISTHPSTITTIPSCIGAMHQNILTMLLV